MDAIEWPLKDEFRNRRAEYEAMRQWWESQSRDALALIGRRRVGKSWLFRYFAVGKKGLILVADRGLLSSQLARFTDQIEASTGMRPELRDAPALIRHLYRLGREKQILAVVDEFPYLLPDGKAREEVLSQIQAVMEEERERSGTRLVLCGSLISQMESLLASDSPLHGRLRVLEVAPMDFAESSTLRDSEEGPPEQIVRFAVCGGMARYLQELGKGPLQEVICSRVLDRHAALFNDPRWVLEQELRAPAPYFSVLDALARRPVGTEKLTDLLQMPSASLWPILNTLQAMRLVRSSLPVGAPRTARSTRHELTDGFMRFWFRFVLPHQEAIEAGLRPEDLWKARVEPELADFTAPAFESLCRGFTRRMLGADAPDLGAWWGKSLNHLRRSGARSVEEIDVVAARGRRLVAVGECKWTARPMREEALSDLLDYKLPALVQEGRLTVPESATDGPLILLFSRAGFEPRLRERADDAGAWPGPVKLIGPDEVVGMLLSVTGAYRPCRAPR